MRRSDRFVLLLGVLALLVAGLPLHASLEARASVPVHEERAALVRELGLTDLCLFVEARYTRHPSMADLHSAFQDHPSALEHFPSGSLLGPPPGLTRQREASQD